MDDLCLMGLAETLADLNRQIYDFVYGKLFLLDNIPQRFPLHILHNDVGSALILAHLVDGDDIGMLQYRGGVGLTLETASTVFVLAKMRGQELESDFAVKFCILGQENLTHPPGTDLLNNLVVGNHCPVGYGNE